MNSDSNVLAQLKDIHHPDAVSIWPLAPGWYILAVLILFFIFLAAFFVYQYLKKQRPRQQALLELEEYYMIFIKDKQHQVFAAKVATLLKRVALTYYPQLSISFWDQKTWCAFLETNLTGKPFSEEEGPKFYEAIYNPRCTYDAEKLKTSAEQWLKLKHPLKIKKAKEVKK